jgi:hypothetical protein
MQLHPQCFQLFQMTTLVCEEFDLSLGLLGIVQSKRVDWLLLELDLGSRQKTRLAGGVVT